MSFSRFTEDSDVYTFFSTSGFYECCMCNLENPDPRYERAEELVRHLLAHEEGGGRVPPRTYQQIFDWALEQERERTS